MAFGFAVITRSQSRRSYLRRVALVVNFDLGWIRAKSRTITRSCNTRISLDAIVYGAKMGRERYVDLSGSTAA